MEKETMTQWNELIASFNKRNEDISIAASNEMSALDVAYRKANAEREDRKAEFMSALKKERREASEAYMEQRRQIKIRQSQQKRELETERQAAYLKFKLEHETNQ